MQDLEKRVELLENQLNPKPKSVKQKRLELARDIIGYCIIAIILFTMVATCASVGMFDSVLKTITSIFISN
jgi:hypothetical protein